MREWISKGELVRRLGITERAIRLRAAKEGWASRLGENGQREYPGDDLPADIQATLRRTATPNPSTARVTLAEEIANTAAHARRADGLARFAAQDDERATARAEILHLFETYRAANRHPTLFEARLAFARAYMERQLEVPAEVRAAVPKLSERTLRRWQVAVEKEGLARLAGRYGNRKGAGRIDQDPEVSDFIVGLIADRPRVKAKLVMRGLRARFPAERVPAYRTVQRFITAWKRDNRQAHEALANPDAFRGRYMAAFGSASENVAGLNALWELDSTPADVMLANGRHSIIGVIDVWSRRTKLLVTRTSKATAIAALMRRAMLDWGVPVIIKTDNGQDYTSRHIKRVVTGLGIEQQLCTPFSPYEKPHIERFFRTFSHDLVELLGGFIGHNVAERREIESQRSFAERLMLPGETVEIQMTAEEFQRFCDRWAADVYHHEAHSGLSNASPLLKAAQWRGAVRRIENERALDVLLAEAPGGDGWRSVTKKGVRVEGGDFIAPELTDVIGEKVRVLYDVTDFGRVYVFNADGQFICIAECPERTGISRKAIAAEARARQRKRIAEERRQLKALAKGANTRDLVEDILAERARANASVVPLPVPGTPHETDALAAAAEAAAYEPRKIAELTPAEIEIADRAWREINGEAEPDKRATAQIIDAATGRPYFADDKEYAEWVMANPDKADDQDRAWLAKKMESKTFRLWLGIEPWEEEKRAASR